MVRGAKTSKRKKIFSAYFYESTQRKKAYKIASICPCKYFAMKIISSAKINSRSGSLLYVSELLMNEFNKNSFRANSIQKWIENWLHASCKIWIWVEYWMHSKWIILNELILWTAFNLNWVMNAIILMQSKWVNSIELNSIWMHLHSGNSIWIRFLNSNPIWSLSFKTYFTRSVMEKFDALY